MFFNTIVVEKDSAIVDDLLGHIALLNADHRRMCKLNTPSDPNYKTFRNAVSATVDKITAECVCTIKKKIFLNEIARVN